MSREPISSRNAVHYRWGGANQDQCDGWHLVRTEELSIIEEAMPPGASETAHHHTHSQQFFYVLEGMLTMRFADRTVDVRSREGIEIAPGEPHQALNLSNAPVRFLVLSQPPSQRDRVESFS